MILDSTSKWEEVLSTETGKGWGGHDEWPIV